MQELALVVWFPWSTGVCFCLFYLQSCEDQGQVELYKLWTWHKGDATLAQHFLFCLGHHHFTIC